MIGAFAAVAVQTLWNRLWSRLRKLRQARYAVGAALGVERSNLYRKLHAYGIRVDRP